MTATVSTSKHGCNDYILGITPNILRCLIEYLFIINEYRYLKYILYIDLCVITLTACLAIYDYIVIYTIPKTYLMDQPYPSCLPRRYTSSIPIPKFCDGIYVGSDSIVDGHLLVDSMDVKYCTKLNNLRVRGNTTSSTLTVSDTTTLNTLTVANIANIHLLNLTGMANFHDITADGTANFYDIYVANTTYTKHLYSTGVVDIQSLKVHNDVYMDNLSVANIICAPNIDIADTINVRNLYSYGKAMLSNLKISNELVVYKLSVLNGANIGGQVHLSNDMRVDSNIYIQQDLHVYGNTYQMNPIRFASDPINLPTTNFTQSETPNNIPLKHLVGIHFEFTTSSTDSKYSLNSIGKRILHYNKNRRMRHVTRTPGVYTRDTTANTDTIPVTTPSSTDMGYLLSSGDQLLYKAPLRNEVFIFNQSVSTNDDVSFRSVNTRQFRINNYIASAYDADLYTTTPDKSYLDLSGCMLMNFAIDCTNTKNPAIGIGGIKVGTIIELEYMCDNILDLPDCNSFFRFRVTKCDTSNEIRMLYAEKHIPSIGILVRGDMDDFIVILCYPYAIPNLMLNMIIKKRV